MHRTYLVSLFLGFYFLLRSIAVSAEPIAVVASFSILGDLVKQLGGEQVKVTTLVGPDEDAHIYQPVPADAVAITQAQLVIINGLHFETWFSRLLKSAKYSGKVVTASDGIAALKVQGEIDPHAWQSLQNIRRYAANISKGLQEIKPQAKEWFIQRLNQFIADVDNLEDRAQKRFQAVPEENRKIVTSHDAFAYLAADFQLDFLAPVGLSTDEEPSGAALAALIEQIRKEGITALFVENISDPRVLRQIARETGTKIGGSLYSDALSSPAGPASTYLQMMEHNLNALATALESPAHSKKE
jgi:zinc/manganese transport system substrate-binding protein